MPKARKGGKKNRKYGRNKAFCIQYRADNREERNRKRRIARHERMMAR
jgi:hypothetical protein